MKEIINGSLYVNGVTNQVERVRSRANTQSVFTTVHGEDLKIVQTKKLKLASSSQVGQYVQESEVANGNGRTIFRSLPPLPTVNAG